MVGAWGTKRSRLFGNFISGGLTGPLARLPGKREIDRFFWLQATLSVDKRTRKLPARPVVRQRYR